MAKWPNIDCTDEIHQVTKKEKQKKTKQNKNLCYRSLYLM